MIPIPMGDMCMACERLYVKCNMLPFGAYRPMGKVDDEGYVVVRCEQFKERGE